METPVTQVAKGIFKIGPLEGGHKAPPTSPYLVIGSKQVAVIEPGEDGQVPGLVEGIKLCSVDMDRVAYIIPTHIHFHHIQGVPLLLKELPKAKFLVHPLAAPHVIEPTRLIQSTIEAWGDKCYGPFYAIPKERVMSVDDGQLLELGGRELEIIYTPGHAPHHISILDRLTRAVWPGDLPSYGDPGHPRMGHDIRPPLFDLEKYLKSVQRLRTLKPSVFLTFHDWGVDFSPEETLSWNEELHLALAHICREGMKQKANFKEILRRAEEWQSSREAMPVGESGLAGGLFGLIAFLHRQDPSLEMPAGSTPLMR